MGNNVNIVDPSGINRSVPEEDLEAELARGARLETTSEGGSRLVSDVKKQEFGGVGGGVKAVVAGVGRGLTFGLSDKVATDVFGYDPARLQGYREENPGLSLTGELAGAVGPGFLSGGLGFGGSLARATPSGALLARTTAMGAKIGGFKGLAAATALEGAAFGAGQAVSELALHDVPLTSEAGLTEIGLSAVFGAGAGVAGGAAAYGLGKVASKLESRATARAGKGATEQLDPFDIKSPRGKEFLTKAEHVTRVQGEAAEALMKNADVAARGVPGEIHLTKHGVSMRQHVLRNIHKEWHDVATVNVGAAPLDAETMGLIKRATASRRAFNEALGHKGDDLAGGLNFERISKLTPEQQKALAGNLRDYEDDVLALAKKVGGERATKEAGERIAEIQKNPRYTIKMPRDVPAMPEVSDALIEAKAARTAFQQSFGITDDVLSAKALTRFTQMSPDDALKAASSWTAYRKAMSNLANKVPSMADDWNRASTEALGELSQLTGEMTAPVAASSVDIMTQLGLVATAGEMSGLVPDVDGPADELLKLYLLRRFLKKNGTLGINSVDPQEAARAAREATMVERGAEAIAGRAARFGGYRVGSKVAETLGVDSGVGKYLIRGKAGNMAQQAIRGGAVLGTSTGKVLARIEAATQKLIKGLDKAKPAAGPTASIVLNKARFAYREAGEDGSAPSGDDLYKSFRKRSQELAQLVANPLAAHQQAYDNLTPVRQAHPIVADRMEMKAVEASQYLFDKMPKDPGNMQRFGVSAWKPDEGAIIKWAQYVKAVQDPVSVLEDAANGTITPAGAETLRTLYPAMFAEAQKTLMMNADDLRKNSTFDQRVRLTVLFGVPVDSAAAPDFVEFQKKFWADRTANQAPLDPENFTPNQPTPGQDLLSK